MNSSCNRFILLSFIELIIFILRCENYSPLLIPNLPDGVYCKHSYKFICREIFDLVYDTDCNIIGAFTGRAFIFEQTDEDPPILPHRTMQTVSRILSCLTTELKSKVNYGEKIFYLDALSVKSTHRGQKIGSRPDSDKHK